MCACEGVCMVIRRQPTSHAFQTTQGKHQQRVKSLKCDVHSKPSPSVKQRYMRKLGYIGITYADKEPHGRDLSWAWPVMGVACLGRSAHEIKRKKKTEEGSKASFSKLNETVICK